MKNIILLFILVTSTVSFSADSTRIDTSYHHSRKKAALLSTFIPGVGSFYNEYGHRKVQGRGNVSWWRAPIYWAGLGVTGYFAYTNGFEARSLKTEWLNRQKTGLEVNYVGITDNELLFGNSTMYGFDDHSKFRDYSIAGFVLIYGLNIIDAFVDAHFVTFDVSQNLTFSFQPKMFTPKNYGVGLTLSFN